MFEKFIKHVKVQILFTVLVLTSSVAFGQKTNKDYNKWSVGLEFGGHDGLNRLVQGTIRFYQFHHYSLNTRYMLNNRFGWKVKASYDRFKWVNKPNPLPNPTHYLNVVIGPTVNLTDVLHFDDFNKRFGALIYLGAGYAQMSSKTFYSAIPYDRPLIDEGQVDRMLVGSFGLTPQYKISERVSVNADISFLFTMRQDRTFDYLQVIPQDGGTTGSFFNWSVGCTFYLGKKKTHADWNYSKRGSSLDTVRISKLEKQLIENQNKLKDDDKDGVLNVIDEELDSKEGALVNVKGVTIDSEEKSVDSDNDGFPDVNDLCPLMKGNVLGCLDSDGDNIPDIIDGCPDEKGSPGANGCLFNEKERIDLEKLGVYDILFASGSSVINDSYKEILNKLAALMKEKQDVNIDMTGYTDQTGSDESNLILSKRRVDSCLKYLESKGINRARFNISFKGETNSKYKGNTTESNAGNRRVAFRVQE
jgi:OOP family OmpA-OmpF porin